MSKNSMDVMLDKIIELKRQMKLEDGSNTKLTADLLKENSELKAKLAVSEAACAEMRAAISSDAGKGWVSPEEHSKVQAVCAELRETLEDIVLRDDVPFDPNWPGLKSAGMCQVAQAVLLKNDIGKGWVNPEEAAGLKIQLHRRSRLCAQMLAAFEAHDLAVAATLDKAPESLCAQLFEEWIEAKK